MVDIVFTAADYATLLADAQTLGYTYVDQQGVTHIKVNGQMIGGGSFFLNYIGTVYEPTGQTTTDAFGNTVPVMAALTGVWGRLRLNGDTTPVPAFSSAITQYKYSQTLKGWTADGTTLAPSYVGSIGLIA